MSKRSNVPHKCIYKLLFNYWYHQGHMCSWLCTDEQCTHHQSDFCVLLLLVNDEVLPRCVKLWWIWMSLPWYLKHHILRHAMHTCTTYAYKYSVRLQVCHTIPSSEEHHSTPFITPQDVVWQTGRLNVHLLPITVRCGSVHKMAATSQLFAQQWSGGLSIRMCAWQLRSANLIIYSSQNLEVTYW